MITQTSTETSTAPCPTCGAPLAGDQRYCLHCGGRRPDARLEFLDVLDADVRARAAAPVATVAGAVPPPRPSGLNARLQANAGVLALGSLLVLMLLVGLLLGHWVTGDRAAAPAAATPAPQVIRVEGTAAPAAAAPAASTATTAAPASTSSSKSGKSSNKAASSPAKGSVSVGALKDKKAVDDAVKKGKPISTGGGKLPPKDSKPAGGGSDFETIG